MFEECGPQDRVVFIEQLQRQPLVALHQRAVAHHVREHDRNELLRKAEIRLQGAEALWESLLLAYNLKRVIAILGAQPLMEAMRA
jgi:ferredoxin-NADP reductase